jgi:hypothetical protein
MGNGSCTGVALFVSASSESYASKCGPAVNPCRSRLVSSPFGGVNDTKTAVCMLLVPVCMCVCVCVCVWMLCVWMYMCVCVCVFV